MEEWRSGKDSRGRVAEAQWKLIMQGTKVCHHVCYPDLLSRGLCADRVFGCDFQCHVACIMTWPLM